MNAIDLNSRPGRSATRGRSEPASGPYPPGATLKTLVAATAFALLAFPGVRAVSAQSLGELDVRSRLGERFFGAIPVEGHRGPLDPRCVRVGPHPAAPEGAQPLAGVRVRIGNAGAADAVIIETAGAVLSPILGLRVEVGCENPVARDFVVMRASPEVPAIPDNIAASTPPAASATPPVRPARAARPVARVAAAAPAAIPQPQGPAVANVVPPVPAQPAPAARAPARVPEVAIPQAPATPAATAGDADAAKRIAELRARSDDHAASLLALEDRLALLQKQAEVLKAQLEYALANSAVQPTTPAQAAPAAVAAPAARAAPVSAAPVTAPSVRKDQGVLGLLTDWRVAAGGLTALLLGAMVVTLRRRASNRRNKEKAAATFRPGATAGWMAYQAAQAGTQPAARGADEHLKTVEFRTPAAPARMQQTDEWQSNGSVPAVDQTAEWVPPPTTDSLPVPHRTPQPPPVEQQMATGPLAGSREFHITQQFQPVAERMVALSSPDEIVQQARTHYMEDGDLFKAIDLLEMAVSARKDSNRPWQALFAIYRRENMPERFQRLALAYRGAFGQDASWPAVRALGRAIDPVNPMYAAEPDDPALPEDLIERWLGVPLDFTAHLLANEMHDQLMETFPGTRRKRKRMASE